MKIWTLEKDSPEFIEAIKVALAADDVKALKTIPDGKFRVFCHPGGYILECEEGVYITYPDGEIYRCPKSPGNADTLRHLAKIKIQKGNNHAENT
jgi:hypothetical protein